MVAGLMLLVVAVPQRGKGGRGFRVGKEVREDCVGKSAETRCQSRQYLGESASQFQSLMSEWPSKRRKDLKNHFKLSSMCRQSPEVARFKISDRLLCEEGRD